VVVVVGLTALAAWRAGSWAEEDLAFALALAGVVILWVPPALFWVVSMQRPVEVGYTVRTVPPATLTGASLPTSALVGLFAVGLAALGRARRRRRGPPACPNPLPGGKPGLPQPPAL
jgi:hypothetical protein